MRQKYPNFRRAQRQRKPGRKMPQISVTSYLLAATGASIGALAGTLLWAQDAPPPSASGANITCTVLWVHDGDTMRCSGYHQSTRLHAIDAPEMPGSCRPGRECTPGDPYASRDYLRALIADKQVMCSQLETDHYGRPVMDCWAGTVNLSCAMVEAGHAVERYGRLNCRR